MHDVSRSFLAHGHHVTKSFLLKHVACSVTVYSQLLQLLNPLLVLEIFLRFARSRLHDLVVQHLGSNTSGPQLRDGESKETEAEQSEDGTCGRLRE